MSGLAGGDPVLTALRGTARVKPYDSRAITRSTSHPTCNLLPVAASMGVAIDTIASYAHEAGLGPEPRRTMSQLARQQGETFDSNVLTDGAAVLAALILPPPEARPHARRPRVRRRAPGAAHRSRAPP